MLPAKTAARRDHQLHSATGLTAASMTKYANIIIHSMLTMRDNSWETDGAPDIW